MFWSDIFSSMGCFCTPNVLSAIRQLNPWWRFSQTSVAWTHLEADKLLVAKVEFVTDKKTKKTKRQKDCSLEGGESGGGHGNVVGWVGVIAKTAEKAVSELAPNLMII